MADFKDLAKDTVRGLGKALEIAARPSRAGAGALGAPKGRALEYALKNLKGERSDDFAWTLRRHGLMKEGIPNAVAGFALDVALDPLGPIAKALNAGTKVATGANIYNLGRETVLEGLRGSKFGRNVLLDTFSRTERLADPEFRRLYRLYESEMSHSAQGAAEKLRETFKGFKSLRGTDDVARAKRSALHRALEEGPTPDFDPEMLTALGRLKNWRKELADAEVAAGVMDPQRLLSNYTPYIFRGTDDGSDVTARVVSAVNAQNKHALKRRLENYDAFLKAGEAQGAEPITDVAEAMLSRALRARKAEASGRLLQKVAANPEWTLAAKPSDAYRTLIPGRYGEMPVGQLFTNKVIRKDVADELNKLIAAPPVKDSDLMRAYNYWINTPFKATATVARPGFALTNLKGNIWNAAIGGANPLDVGAHGVAGWVRSITGGGEPRIAEQIGSLTPDVLNEFARRHGIIGAGVGQLQDVARPEGIQAVEKMLQGIPVGRESWLDKVPGLNKYMGAMEHASGSLEDASKMTVFMDYVRRNPDKLTDTQRLLEDAALHTKRYLFDYSEVTPREQALRSTLVPFLTFAKKSLPLQVEAAVTKPQMISGLAHFQRGGENAVPEAERIPEQFIPEWLKAYGGTQIPWNKLHEALPEVFGETQGATFINPYLPIGDLDPLLAPDRLLDELGGRLGPVPKAAIEAMANRNLLYGPQSTLHAPATRYSDPSPVPPAMRWLAGDVAPTPLWHLPQTFVPALSTVGRTFTPTDQSQQRILNFLFGAGLYNQTPNQLVNTAKRVVGEKRRRDATLRRLNTLK